MENLKPQPLSALFQKIRYTFELVKFSHTIFALPFALVAFFLASRGNFEWQKLFWILLCLVSARSAAMAFNRSVDAKFDAQNPRTQNRHIPAGLLSTRFVSIFTLVSSAIFIYSASRLNSLSFTLSPFCLFVLFSYSLAKRWTTYTQLILGFCLGMAPIGATIATTGSISLSSIVLAFSVLCWVAGFDLIYAIQDIDFDQQQKLHSMPAKLGVRSSLRLSAILHSFFLAGLVIYGILGGFHWIYGIGVLLSAYFLWKQHQMIRQDLNKVDVAFFTMNGFLSLLFCMLALLDLFLLD